MPKKPIKITLKPVPDEQLFNRYLLNLETAFEKIFGYAPNPGDERVRSNAAKIICDNQITASEIIHIFNSVIFLKTGINGIVLTEKGVYVNDVNCPVNFSVLYSDIDSVYSVILEHITKPTIVILKMKDGTEYSINFTKEEPEKLVQFLNYAKNKKY